MAYSGFERNTISSQNSHTSSSTACLDLTPLFIRSYTKTKRDAIFTLYVQMLLCTNYSTVSTHLDSNHIRTANYHHQLLNMRDRHYIQDCAVLSTKSYPQMSLANKSLELSQLPDGRLQHRRVVRPLRRFQSPSSTSQLESLQASHTTWTPSSTSMPTTACSFGASQSST